jgi:hypothetical protein
MLHALPMLFYIDNVEARITLQLVPILIGNTRSAEAGGKLQHVGSI